MPIMPILVPFAFLATGFVVVMILLARSLRSLEAETDKTWNLVQEKRAACHDAAERFLQIAREQAPAASLDAIERALGSCRDAAEPLQAAQADDALAHALHEAEGQRGSWSADLANAFDEVVAADEAIGPERLLYNNRAVTHNNDGVSFPTNLIAKRMGFRMRETYQPHDAAGARSDRQSANLNTLAEASPRIMNAYMWWAVSLSGTTMDTVEPEKK